jgi:hypothetical protein
MLLQFKPGKVAAAAKTRNANPMRNRVATGLKAKPMPATATTMVKVRCHRMCVCMLHNLGSMGRWCTTCFYPAWHKASV